MMLLGLVPLVLALSACLLISVAPYLPALEQRLSHAALAIFGTTVRDDESFVETKRGQLRAVHVAVTYRVYAARTLLYASVFAIAGAIIGVYMIAGGLALLSIPDGSVGSLMPDQLSFLVLAVGSLNLPTFVKLLALLLAGGAICGFGAGFAIYVIRWIMPAYKADARGRQIDESLSRNVAFMYALSRSGMAFSDIMRILAENRSVYGGAATEFSVAVRQMENAGLNLFSALEQVSNQTPSKSFEEFSENLVNILQSGSSVSTFLYNQYEYHHEEDEVKQEQFLDLLATLAEGYVSLLVVGPLLMITILVIIGLTGMANTEPVLQLLAYLAIPLGTIVFLLYLDSMTENLTITETVGQEETPVESAVLRDSTPEARTDGGTFEAGTDPNVERFRIHQSLSDLRRTLSDPLRTVAERPLTLLYVTVPLALLSIVVRLALVPAGTPIGPGTVDDVVVQATLFVLGTFAVAQEYHHRKMEALEAAVPDLLERLANINEAGMSVVESFERVTSTDLGALNEEMDRMWMDIRLGATIETSLRRFETRMRTPMVTRVVTLLTNAMRSSGDLGSILRIAANDAQTTRRLKESRKQEMTTYLVVIYLSFGVFLIIIASLTGILIPNLPTSESIPSTAGGAGEGFTSALLSSDDAASYSMLLFHTALVQAVASGFVAGQMGEENVKNGAKHAVIMLVIAYLMFLAY